MQTIIISGYLSRDPELSTTGNDDVCRLNIPVKQGWGEREQTNWYRASVWGKRAKTVADKCRKGTKVNIIGELQIGEYQGKPQYDIRVNDIDWTAPKSQQDQWGDAGDTGNGQSARSHGNTRGPVDDDDDFIPFITSAGVF